MKTFKTNQPRLPKGRVMYAEVTTHDAMPGGHQLPCWPKAHTDSMIPLAVLPCRTAREAKAIVAKHNALITGDSK